MRKEDWDSIRGDNLRDGDRNLGLERGLSVRCQPRFNDILARLQIQLFGRCPILLAGNGNVPNFGYEELIRRPKIDRLAGRVADCEIE